VEVWRLLTGEARFDDLLVKHGSPYLKYRLQGNTAVIQTQLTNLLRDVGRNCPLVTTEGYFTDRIEMRDLRGPDDNVLSLLESMYLGAPLVNLFYPFSAVFWSKTDSSFSALVEYATPTSLRIRVFNHSRKATSGIAKFLQLEPGQYEIVQGRDENNDGIIDQVRNRTTVKLAQRNASASFTFVPHAEELILIHQRGSLKLSERPVCDLAMTVSELKVERGRSGDVTVSIPVHNIGTADVANVQLELVSESPEAVVGRASIPKLRAPLDLLPKHEYVSFMFADRPGRYSIRIVSPSDVPEITLLNNSITFER
jgi:hypothetical protein